jgi:hypothetical protein
MIGSNLEQLRLLRKGQNGRQKQPEPVPTLQGDAEGRKDALQQLGGRRPSL